MMDDKKLDAAYALSTPEDSKKLYADWAETYDADFADAKRYVLHAEVARAFIEAGGQGPVLDVGAGTGLCGIVLAQAGLKQIDGTDISEEMLEVAAHKDVYRDLFAGNILTRLGRPDGSYDGIVSSGTFTLGHVGPDGLDEVMRLLTPGGLAVIAVRDAHFEAEGFDDKLDNLAPQIARQRRTEVPIYASGATGPHAQDRAVLLHLWKA